MSFGVVDDDLRVAAKHADAASDQARGLVLRAGPEQITAALPGGTAAKAADVLGKDWGDEIRQWAEATEIYGRAMTKCANQYFDDDTAAADMLARIELSHFEGL